MRVLLIFTAAAALVLADETRPHCTSQDYFAMNIYALVMQPLVDRTTFVMAPSQTQSRCVVETVPCEMHGDTCEALHVRHGIDVLAVWGRVLLGWPRDYHCVFDECPMLTTVAGAGGQVKHSPCRLATRTMRCAWERLYWGAAYVLLALVLCVGFATMAALSICGR